jgi:hypothetical protein
MSKFQVDNGCSCLLELQPRTQGICSWGSKYPGMAWSRDPRILRKMAYCLLGGVSIHCHS